MPAFINDAKRATEALFAHEPFKELQSKFNIIAVKSPSKESGTSIPSKGIWKETALQSSFDTFYSDRYLTTLHVKKDSPMACRFTLRTYYYISKHI